jgi:hypothetical protein
VVKRARKRPTKLDAKRAADMLRNRDLKGVRATAAEFYIANLRQWESPHLALRQEIADFLEIHHLREGHGAKPASSWKRSHAAWCWMQIERRAIFWRDVFRERCPRRFPEREALRRVAYEIGGTVDALEKGLRRWRKYLRN